MNPPQEKGGREQKNSITYKPTADVWFRPEQMQKALATLRAANFKTYPVTPDLMARGYLFAALRPRTEESYFIAARELSGIANFGVEFLRGGAPKPTPYQQRNERQRAETLAATLCAGVATAPHGERQNILSKAAYAMGGIVGAAHLDFQTAFTLLVDAALEIGLPLAEAKDTARRGIRKGETRPFDFAKSKKSWAQRARW